MHWSRFHLSILEQEARRKGLNAIINENTAPSIAIKLNLSLEEIASRAGKMILEASKYDKQSHGV